MEVGIGGDLSARFDARAVRIERHQFGLLAVHGHVIKGGHLSEFVSNAAVSRGHEGGEGRPRQDEIACFDAAH